MPTTRPFLLALLPLLALDCAAAMLVGESPRKTLSGAAWHARDHKYWGWTHRAIDALFRRWDPDHCRGQAEREAKHGSVWAAWAHDWRQSKTK